jgi:predicted nucleic acid-binding protein
LTICVDSSFLVSSYISDSNSAESDRRRSNNPAIWITPLNRSEFSHSAYQHVFRGSLNLAEANQLWSIFEEDCASGLWVQTTLPDSVWRASIDLARRHGPTLGTRTLDSLHVACALELRAERFWTFDQRQARLAEAVGLDTTG